jgi:hypothetical protein
MRNVFFILLILCGFAQCAEPCDTCGEGKIMENYVLKYYILSDYSSIFITTPEKDSAGVSFEIGFYNNEAISPLLSENEEIHAKFREIARNNGDTAYYRPISTCFPYTCLSDKAGRFDIYCDREYAGYPAETLLNEFVTICFYSVDEFVKSGYISPDTVKQYCMPLTEFNAGNYYLMASNHISFVLKVKPDYPAEYRFIFTYSDSSVELIAYVFKIFD